MSAQKAEPARTLTAGGNLRAAVFGISDGLVSNTSLILGVAGALADSRTILITGAAGLLAGALSMAAGEYVSVSSQRELFERQIDQERDELAQDPKGEIDVLARIYRARGLPLDIACRISKALSSDLKVALETHAREELGLNPADLGSPLGAALSSFGSFAVGALVPLVPFFFGGGGRTFALAVALAGAALFVVGITVARLTGQRGLRGGIRMLGIGGGAGVLAYLIGTLLGASIA